METTMNVEFDERYGVRDRADFERKSRVVQDRFLDRVRSASGITKIADHLYALYHYMGDPGVHWAKKAVVVSALLYFVVPLDSVPDFIPVAGFLDDIGIISLTVRYVGKQLRGYYL
jgi:uncharacterized membrane protein YkvA (DUF1232 family)